MPVTPKLAAGPMLALLLTSCASSPAVRTEIVEVPVEVTVPLDAQLTRPEAAPVRPPLRCRDAEGRPTLCNCDLANWLNAYDRALAALNDRMARIRGLQPKGD